MRRKRRKSLGYWLRMKWLFPHHSMLRIICIVVILISAFFTYRGISTYIDIQQQEDELSIEKEKLVKEREILETKKKDLEDPQKLEKKARDELGLVKPGEVPYVR